MSPPGYPWVLSIKFSPFDPADLLARGNIYIYECLVLLSRQLRWNSKRKKRIFLIWFPSIHECQKKFQPIRSSCLTGYKEHLKMSYIDIYNKLFIFNCEFSTKMYRVAFQEQEITQSDQIKVSRVPSWIGHCHLSREGHLKLHLQLNETRVNPDFSIYVRSRPSKDSTFAKLGFDTTQSVFISS